MNGDLLLINPDGTNNMIRNGYEGLRDAIGGAFDFVDAQGSVGIYVHDEGMLIGLPLNTPVSIMIGRPLYGPCVICAPEPDEEGDTLPAPDSTVAAFRAIARLWSMVVSNALHVGQTVDVYPNADTIPPPTVTEFSAEEFENFMGWRKAED